MSTAELPSYLEPGACLDAYRIREWKGGGAYGDVYLGEKDGRPVALKLSKHRQSSDDPGKTYLRQLRELVCLVQVDHPNIARVLGWTRTEAGHGYLVLEYVDGWTLAEWLQQTCPTLQEVVRCFAKLAQAVEHMHGRGVRHRDISPSNIMVRRGDGGPVLIDLGAGEYSGAQELTDGPLPPGTHRYRSPEAARFLKENQSDPRARYPFPSEDDFYSLAVCLYDALTDPEPARKGTARKAPRIDVNSSTRPPPPARLANPRVPQPLSEWVERWLDRDPAKRLPALASMREALEELARRDGEEWLSPVHPAMEEAEASAGANRRPPAGTWRRVLAWVMAAAALAVISTLALLREAPPGEEPSARLVQESPSQPRAEAPQAPPSPPVPPASAVPSPVEVPPVAKESPAVSPPQSPPAVKKETSTPAFSPGFLKRCALAGASAAALMGCPASQVMPARERCPEGAVKNMQRFGLDSFFIAHVDANNPDAPVCKYSSAPDGNCLIPVGDGSIESIVIDGSGRLTSGSRLYGQVWTGGTEVVIRYTRATTPEGLDLDICAVLGSSAEGFPMTKFPGSKPGAALVRARYPGFFVFGQWP